MKTIPRLSSLCIFATCALTSVSSVQAYSIDQVMDDMKKAHEYRPHGVPTAFDWQDKPKWKKQAPPSNAKRTNWWGHLYEDTQLNPSGNTRVKFRNFRLYVLKSNNTWQQLQAGNNFNGAAWREDFGNNNDNIAGDKRTESDGLISLRAGCKAWKNGSNQCGRNFHNFHPSRALLPSGVQGIFVSGQAITIRHNSSGNDDRAASRYIFSMGADYFTSNTSGVLGDVGIGRFKRVKTSWRTFTMHSLTESKIRAYPPPGITGGGSSSSSSSGSYLMSDHGFKDFKKRTDYSYRFQPEVKTEGQTKTLTSAENPFFKVRSGVSQPQSNQESQIAETFSYLNENNSL